MRCVLAADFTVEGSKLNSAVRDRLVRRLVRRPMDRPRPVAAVELGRLRPDQRRAEWRARDDDVCMTYSKLFFHPDLGLRPQPYPVRLERLLARRAPARVASRAL